MQTWDTPVFCLFVSETNLNTFGGNFEFFVLRVVTYVCV